MQLSGAVPTDPRDPRLVRCCYNVAAVPGVPGEGLEDCLRQRALLAGRQAAHVDVDDVAAPVANELCAQAHGLLASLVLLTPPKWLHAFTLRQAGALRSARRHICLL